MAKPIIALLYDFDKTLCTKDMQEFAFIPEINMDAPVFWAATNKMAEEHDMDPILAYMYMMIQKATAADKPIRREDFQRMGKKIEYFPGVKQWFSRINEYGKQLGVQIEHYVISSGLKELIDGTDIVDYFKKVYACEFLYDASGVAKWPALAVNYTGKTQFLFRINKGFLDVYDDKSVNKSMSDEERRVSFKNMIYIGDGITDIPCMKLVKEYGGQSLAVYTEERKDIAYQLLREERVNYIAKSDYRKGKELDKIVQIIIKEMSVKNVLEEYRQIQKRIVLKD